MKDFDTERRERHEKRERELGDRTFVLSGETFTWKANASYTVLEQVASTEDEDGTDLIHAMEQAIVAMLEDGQEERFLEVVRNKDDTYTFEDLNALARWLVEEQVKRPTLAPLPSTAMGANQESSTASTADSSLPPAEESAA